MTNLQQYSCLDFMSAQSEALCVFPQWEDFSSPDPISAVNFPPIPLPVSLPPLTLSQTSDVIGQLCVSVHSGGIKPRLLSNTQNSASTKTHCCLPDDVLLIYNTSTDFGSVAINNVSRTCNMLEKVGPKQFEQQMNRSVIFMLN